MEQAAACAPAQLGLCSRSVAMRCPVGRRGLFPRAWRLKGPLPLHRLVPCLPLSTWQPPHWSGTGVGDRQEVPAALCPSAWPAGVWATGQHALSQCPWGGLGLGNHCRATGAACSLEARPEKCTWLVSVTFQLWPVGVGWSALCTLGAGAGEAPMTRARARRFASVLLLQCGSASCWKCGVLTEITWKMIQLKSLLP